MLAVLDQGRARGFKRAQITPYADNEASVKAYEKVGFKGTTKLQALRFSRSSSSLALTLRDVQSIAPSPPPYSNSTYPTRSAPCTCAWNYDPLHEQKQRKRAIPLPQRARSSFLRLRPFVRIPLPFLAVQAKM
jgi:hypothetical protein